MATIERAIPVGGASLNFAVVGGTTQPSNPKENTIWVNTDTEITDWAFSADEPTAAAGKVWTKVSSSSSAAFNALKKNAISVYPTAAYQYIDGAWVNKAALIFIDGEWLEWSSYLYKYGDFLNGITDAVCPNDVTKVTKYDTYFTVYCHSPGSYFTDRVGFLTPAFDFTDVNALRVTFGFSTGIGTQTTNYKMTTIGLTSSATDGTVAPTFITSKGFMNQEITDRDNMVIDIDTSAVTGLRYVAFQATAYNTTSTVTVRSVECL